MPIVSELADDEVIGPLLGEFVRDLVQTARDAEAAAARGDRRAVLELCHRLRGTAATFGFPPVSAVAEVAERLAAQPGTSADALHRAASDVRAIADQLALPPIPTSATTD